MEIFSLALERGSNGTLVARQKWVAASGNQFTRDTPIIEKMPEYAQNILPPPHEGPMLIGVVVFPDGTCSHVVGHQRNTVKYEVPNACKV